jgi:hypothetical protein
MKNIILALIIATALISCASADSKNKVKTREYTPQAGWQIPTFNSSGVSVVADLDAVVLATKQALLDYGFDKITVVPPEDDYHYAIHGMQSKILPDKNKQQVYRNVIVNIESEKPTEQYAIARYYLIPVDPKVKPESDFGVSNHEKYIASNIASIVAERAYKKRDLRRSFINTNQHSYQSNLSGTALHDSVIKAVKALGGNVRSDSQDHIVAALPSTKSDSEYSKCSDERSQTRVYDIMIFAGRGDKAIADLFVTNEIFYKPDGLVCGKYSLKDVEGSEALARYRRLNTMDNIFMAIAIGAEKHKPHTDVIEVFYEAQSQYYDNMLKLLAATN